MKNNSGASLNFMGTYNMGITALLFRMIMNTMELKILKILLALMMHWKKTMLKE